MAQKSQQNRSLSPPRGPQKGNGTPDTRAVNRSTQQRASRLNGEKSGNDTDHTHESAPRPLSGTIKPFTEAQRDSPTISDVSSVTAPSNPPTTTAQQQPQQSQPPQDLHASSAFQTEATKPLVRQVFEKYEKNRCGWISLANLQELCYDFGTFLREDELKLAISEIDVDRDGRLSYEDFMVWWRTNDQFRSPSLSPPVSSRHHALAP
jgi:hypothetical protein